MSSKQVSLDRITFTLPNSLNMALDSLKDEFHRSKSEIIKLAIESYIAKQNKIKLQKAVDIMSDEYKTNEQLTEFSSLDGEEFL